MSKQTELVGLARTTNLDEVNAAYSAGALSNRNLIINGEFLVWQRSDNGYNGGGNAYLSADRFSTTRGRIRKPNTNGNTGEDNRGAVFDTMDNNVYCHFDYAVEDVGQKLHGKTMTFSFYAKVLSGSDSLYIEGPDGDGFYFGGNAVIQLTSNWKRYTFTGTVVSTGASGGVKMPRWYLNASGSALPRMIQIDQVQLEVGPVATPFEHRSYGDTLAQCQRYYWQTSSPNGHPYNGGYLAVRYTGNLNQYGAVIDLPVAMRTLPTTTHSLASVHKPNIILEAISSASTYSERADAVAIAVTPVTDHGTGVAGLYPYGGNITADAEL